MKTKIDATLKKILPSFTLFSVQESILELSFVIRLFVPYVDCKSSSIAWLVAHGARVNRERKIAAQNSGVVPYVLRRKNLHWCQQTV